MNEYYFCVIDGTSPRDIEELTRVTPLSVIYYVDWLVKSTVWRTIKIRCNAHTVSSYNVGRVCRRTFKIFQKRIANKIENTGTFT